MTALAMIETMERLWNHVVPLIGRKRSAGITGGCRKARHVAAIHWPESAHAVDRLGVRWGPSNGGQQIEIAGRGAGVIEEARAD